MINYTQNELKFINGLIREIPKCYLSFYQELYNIEIDILTYKIEKNLYEVRMNDSSEKM